MMEQKIRGNEPYQLIAVEVEAWRAVSGDLDDFIYHEEQEQQHSER